MIKVVVCFISIALLLGFLGNQIVVKAVSNQETRNVSTMFREFITEYFSDEDKVQGYIDAVNVTESFLNKYRNTFNKNDFLTINQVAINTNHSITCNVKFPTVKRISTNKGQVSRFSVYYRCSYMGTCKDFVIMLSEALDYGVINRGCFKCMI